MTLDPHRRALDKWEHAVDRPRERDEWRQQAQILANTADSLLAEWRVLAAKQGKHLGHYDQNGD